ncbi:MAG: DNA polymerase III subunit tau [Elusimicrobia bacterium ADurb.Bin231]|nr:MAG: DNA polymerase III subunit tau [Elusimicrobia bacterium ADurb.Bin231]
MKIIGHRERQDMLLNAVRNNRVHSSYLFVGQSGIGKRQVALYFAQMLNCLAIEKSGFPCGKCRSCRKIESGTHPDVATISLLEDKSFISIDQIKEMISGLQYRALEGKYSVRIIDDCHLIQDVAANSLLKVLEEPPANTVIILITSSPRTLPQTILSRCVSMYFGSFTEQEIRAELKKKGVPESSENFIVSASSGSLGRAISLVRDSEFIESHKNIIEDFVRGKLPEKRIDRKKTAEFLDILACFVRYKVPEKLEEVLLTKSYIRKNVNIELALELLRIEMKE